MLTYQSIDISPPSLPSHLHSEIILSPSSPCQKSPWFRRDRCFDFSGYYSEKYVRRGVYLSDQEMCAFNALVVPACRTVTKRQPKTPITQAAPYVGGPLEDTINDLDVTCPVRYRYIRVNERSGVCISEDLDRGSCFSGTRYIHGRVCILRVCICGR